MKPRIFISAVTPELGQTRQLAANVLMRLGYDPVWQDIFGTEPGDLRQMLRDKIDDCGGLVHLVGRAYGAEPPQPDPDFGRVSYTQFEFLHAQKKGKKTWVLFAEEGYPPDKPLEQLDLPPDPAHDNPAAFQAQRRALQDAWRERLRGESHLWHAATSKDGFELQIERLKDEFRGLRRRFRLWQQMVAAALVILLILGGGIWWTVQKTGESQQRIEAELAKIKPEHIKEQLRETIETAYRKELREADQLSDWKKRADAKKDAAAARDRKLGQVNEFLTSITTTIKSGGASPEFLELMRIVQEQGVDEALRYIAAQKPRLLDEARNLNEARLLAVRKTLAPLLEEARLQLTRGNALAAGEGCDALLALDPNWGEVLHEKFQGLTALGGRAILYGTLSQSLKYYEDAKRTASRLAAISDPHPLADHDLLVSCYNLGKVSLRAAKLPEAIRHYREYLRIAERLAADPANAEGRRDLSIAYEILGDVSLRQDNPADAIKYYRQDLDIAIQTAAAQPASHQAQRDLMISYERLGDATKAAGQSGEALALFRKSMEIARSLATDPQNRQAQRDLAAAYERLGNASSSARKPQEAIACYQQYRAIAERLVAADRANVQAKQDLAGAYEQLGDESMKAGAVNDALAFYGKFMDIARSLAADPDNAVAQRDLWSAHTHLGHALSRRGDTRRAIAEFDAGQAIADAELAKNQDFFDPYDRACYASLKVLKFSLEHPHPDAKQNKLREALIEAALRAVQALLATPFQDLAQIREEPDLVALVALPQFETLLQQKARDGKN
jgi:tetratricopeptide (TPR) repeat protein